MKEKSLRRKMNHSQSNHHTKWWCDVYFQEGKIIRKKIIIAQNFLQETASYLLFTVLSSADKLCFFLEKQNFIFES